MNYFPIFLNIIFLNITDILLQMRVRPSTLIIPKVNFIIP